MASGWSGLSEAGKATAYAAVALVVIGSVAVGALGVLLATEDAGDTTLATRPTDDVGRETTLACGSGTEARGGGCGPGPDGSATSDRGGAERLEFAGDPVAAATLADRAQAALEPLAGAFADPTADQVRAALTPVDPDVAVSSGAEGGSGTAFGIALPGGCVYGVVADGTVEVDVGGYVRIGGCLAT
jgi:hypothetical protein